MRVILKLLTVATIFVLSACAARRPQIGSADVDWSKRAEEVSPGMTRAEVRRILPPWDGPPGALLSAEIVSSINGTGQTESYWVSQDWRVSIFYDYTGGASSGLNLVKEPAMIEKISYYAPTILYLHFGYEGSDSTRRLLSTRIHLGERIFVAGEEHWELTGSIERRGTNLVADLLGNTGSQNQFYKGIVTLEKPFYAQGGAASGGVEPLWFAISTNSDSKPLLESLKKATRERLQGIR